MNKFKRIIVGEKEYTALRFGNDSYEMPPSVMQNTRKDGLIITDEGIRSYPWYGITKDRDGQYILLPPSEYEDIRTISLAHRDRALSLVRKIALGLKEAEKSFPDLLSGIFPLYRIIIEKGENIVLLSPDAGSILTLSHTPEETDRDVRTLIVPDKEKSFTLALEMVQLLYYALCGRFPYERADVRGSGFRAYDLSLYGYEGENASFIMKSLEMKVKDQRKICLNYSEQYALGWFLSLTEKLEWRETARKEEETAESINKSEESPVFCSLMERKERKAKRHRLFREKGAVALLITLVAAGVIWFAGNFIYQEVKAPDTKALTPIGIIEYTIEKQNELDAGSINEGFKGEAAQYMEVTSLYVSSRTMLAYSQKNTIISAPEWIEGGRGAIDEECTVYGVIIKSIEAVSENTYTAHLEYYTPYAFYNEDEEDNSINEDSARVFVYSVDETFVFEWNKRGWWICTSSEFEDASLIEVLNIPYSTTGKISSD